MITFEKIGIREELIKAVTDMGFEIPMPVQEQVIPAVLTTDNDIIGLSQTGTGKTAAYGLPLLNSVDETNNNPQVLVLCPTRELCIQITKDFCAFSKYLTKVKSISVYGGASIENQIKDIKNGVNVIVATPGRMNDLIRRKKVVLSDIKSLVLDEADEMLNMGFKEELNKIIETLPSNRRTLLFSATMPADVRKIASQYMHNIKEIIIGKANSGADNVKHHFYVVKSSDRYIALKRIVDYYPSVYGIVFCRTRNETKEVAEKLMKDGYSADALHGDLSQAQREYTMQRFRLKNLQLLVATDVAARGIDVDDLTHIINYNPPDEDEAYIHRSGRTGRAGKKGVSIIISNIRDKNKIQRISKNSNIKFEFKNVPKGEEICEKQLFSLINKMENIVVNDEQIVDFLPIVYKKLEWMSREELIKKFVSIEFNRFLNYYKDAVDINSDFSSNRNDNNKQFESKRDKDGDFTYLRINIGKLENLTPPKLIGLINDYTKTRDIIIGKVTISQTYTLFQAETQYVNAIVKHLDNVKFENREISVKVADEKSFKSRSPKNRDKNNNSRKDRRRY